MTSRLIINVIWTEQNFEIIKIMNFFRISCVGINLNLMDYEKKSILRPYVIERIDSDSHVCEWYEYTLSIFISFTKYHAHGTWSESYVKSSLYIQYKLLGDRRCFRVYLQTFLLKPASFSIIVSHLLFIITKKWEKKIKKNK